MVNDYKNDYKLEMYKVSEEYNRTEHFFRFRYLDKAVFWFSIIESNSNMFAAYVNFLNEYTEANVDENIIDKAKGISAYLDCSKNSNDVFWVSKAKLNCPATGSIVSYEADFLAYELIEKSNTLKKVRGFFNFFTPDTWKAFIPNSD